MPCSTLSMAIVVITGLTPAKRTIQPLTRADQSPASRQPAMPERQLRRPHVGGDDEGGEHHRQAHHRADRNVEAAHQQHVELRHGDQRQRRGREQDVAKVDRGQEDVRLRRRVGADQRRQRQQEAERDPPFAAAGRQRLEDAVKQASAARSARSAQRLPGHQEGRDDVLLGHVGAGQLADDAAARKHQHAVANAGELQRIGRIDDAAPALGRLGADGAVDLEAGAWHRRLASARRSARHRRRRGNSGPAPTSAGCRRTGR